METVNETNISKHSITSITMDVIPVSTKGQIVIPEAVRKRHHIKPGSRLVLVERGDMLVLRRESDVEHNIGSAWTALAERSLKKTWDNPKDGKEWKRYV